MELDIRQFKCEVRIVPAEDGWFTGYVANLKGVHSQGRTELQTLASVRSALRAILLTYQENNQEVPWSEPEPQKDNEQSIWIVEPSNYDEFELDTTVRQIMQSPTQLPEKLFAAVNEAEKKSYIDRALDIIYDTIDELMIQGEFDICARILDEINVKHFSTESLIGFLTITFAAKSKISSRIKFLAAVASELAYRGETDPMLLQGLD